MPLTRQETLAQLTAAGEPYELEAIEINGIPCRAFVNAPQSLRELFAETVSDATCFVYEDERYSFSEMYAQACQLATALMED